MIDLLCGALALLAAAGLGAGVLYGARARPADARDGILWMLAVGLGAWGLLGLGLAAAHLLRPGVVLALALFGLVIGGRDVWRTVAGLLQARRRFSVLMAPAVMLLVVGVAVMAPVVTGDQTKYQLAYPKLYAQAGGLVATPWTFWGNQQFVQNFLFAVAYTVRGERLALLLNAAWLPLAAGALARLVDRHLWRGVGGVAAALLITLPMAWSLATKAGADLTLVACTTLALGAFLDWRRREDGGALRRCALAAGLAGGTKVMGLLTPALLGASLLYLAWSRRRSLAASLRVGLVFGVLAGAVAAPPYVRNALETGNPLHPFAAGVFASRNWNVEAARYLDEYYRQYQVERAARRAGAPYRGLELLRFPWDVTMVPESFERAARQSLDLGPFALAFLPAALWFAWRHRPGAWVFGVGAAYVIAIAAGVWAHPRYVLPGVALVLAVATAGARALGGRWFPAVVAWTLVGHLVIVSRLALPMLPDQLRVVAGRLSREEYLQRYSERYGFWRRACPVVGTTGLVLVLEKIPHPYFIDCPFVLASYLEQAMIDYRTIGTVPDLEQAAQRLGITHIAVSQVDLERRADPYEARVAALWRGWTVRLGEPQLEVAPYALYALPRPGTPAR
jgi:hypothetical protein